MVLADTFYYQPVQIDTINTRVNADLFAKEGDANGRGMVVQITENGIIKDTTGITLRLQWSHISVGTSGFTDFEIVDATKGLYKLKYPTSMLHRGRVEAFIRITDNGKLSGTRNLLITVERMVGSDETIEAADDYTALQTALTKLSAWEGTISGKVDTWEADMEATKQLYIDTLNDAEAAYPQELVALQGQLADVAEQLSPTNQPIVDTGNYFSADNTNAALQELGAHKASTSNPHGVTKAQVGLGSVDNTSDVNKPVSTATQTALNLKANKLQEAWITPTLINGWVAFGGAEDGPTYYKDDFGNVKLRGVVKSGTLSVSIFKLPIGYRPAKNKYCPVISNNVPGFVLIDPSGGVIPHAGTSNVFVALDSISFKVD